MKNLVHYKGKIGEFDYDPNIWEISKGYCYDCLKFKNVYVEDLELPKGLISCANMFEDCILPEKFTLGEEFIITDEVETEDMFKDCQMPNSFKEKYKDLILKAQ